MDLEGKVALVTGGAHRVGKEITMMLARAGACVVVNYNSSAVAAQETVCEAKAQGVDALAIKCDVTDWDAVQAMASSVRAEFGRIDVIINSASLFAKMSFPTASLEVWRRVTAVSIDGPFFVCNSLVPLMQSGNGGVIINIVDLSAWIPWPGFMAHSVGKAALLGLTRQLALELAPEIRANAVALGPVLAPKHYSEEQKAALAKRTLLKRWGVPNDAANAVKYLIEADFVTGEVLTVDGGERYA